MTPKAKGSYFGLKHLEQTTLNYKCPSQAKPGQHYPQHNPRASHLDPLMSLAHLVLPHTHLFSLFYYFLHIADPPPCTLPPHHHGLTCEPPHLLVHNTCLHSISLALLSWWTDDLQFTCYIFFLSYLMCTLLWPNQSWIIMLHSQALIIVSPQMSLVLTFLIVIHI